jgi:hypothetical protein
VKRGKFCVSALVSFTISSFEGRSSLNTHGVLSMMGYCRHLSLLCMPISAWQKSTDNKRQLSTTLIQPPSIILPIMYDIQARIAEML